MYRHARAYYTESRIPCAYAEVAQIVSHLKEAVVIISNVVEICGIILEVIQNGHNGALLVVGEQRLEADVLKSNAAV